MWGVTKTKFTKMCCIYIKIQMSGEKYKLLRYHEDKEPGICGFDTEGLQLATVCLVVRNSGLFLRSRCLFNKDRISGEGFCGVLF